MNSTDGDWVAITATEAIVEEEAETGEAERQWRSPHETDAKFRAKLSAVYHVQLEQLQQSEGVNSDDPEYCRVHPDFQAQTDRQILDIAKQFNVLAVDKHTETK